ncbi:MAG: hypothetical protein QW179_04190 [Candidatus Hadarchaeales archaeon]
MRGQTAPEALILISAILLSVASLAYLGTASNDSAVALRVVRDGAENILAQIDFDYGCSSEVESVEIAGSRATVWVAVRDAPPGSFSWDNFRENILIKGLKDNLPIYIARHAAKDYTVEVSVRRVSK